MSAPSGAFTVVARAVFAGGEACWLRRATMLHFAALQFAVKLQKTRQVTDNPAAGLFRR